MARGVVWLTTCRMDSEVIISSSAVANWKESPSQNGRVARGFQSKLLSSNQFNCP